jgi:hypothetical protein
LSVSAGYSPVELMFDSSRSDFFEKFRKERSEKKLPAVSLQEVSKSVRQDEEGGSETEQMEQNCSSKLEPQLGDTFLVKSQAVSDGIAKTL